MNGSPAGESVNLIGITSTLLVTGAPATPLPCASGNARMVIWLVSSATPSAAIVPEALTTHAGAQRIGYHRQVQRRHLLGAVVHPDAVLATSLGEVILVENYQRALRLLAVLRRERAFPRNLAPRAGR